VQGRSLQEVTMTDAHIVSPSRWGYGALSLLLASITFAKATVVTLPELIHQSRVIAYGRIDPNAGVPVPFHVSTIAKGADVVQGSGIFLCNSRPNPEWPDLSKSVGEQVLFLVKHGECFDLSHNYRSLIKVHDGRASTIVIKDQPDDQSLDDLLEKIRVMLHRDGAA
jgi:hypothetical protein